MGTPDPQHSPGLFAAAQQGEGGCFASERCCSVVAVALLCVQHQRLFGSADCEQSAAAAEMLFTDSSFLNCCVKE